MTEVTIVTGTDAQARETAIVARLEPGLRISVILEGIPSGISPLANVARRDLHVARIAPGCICCTGNLTMKVTLNRMLRLKPHRLYISLATSTHLAQVRTFLSQAPYDGLLQLSQDLQV